MLREFDLDAPKEAKAIRSRFRLETRCVTALFERCFASRPKGIKEWKLLVEAVPTIKRREPRDLLGVLTIEQQFDIAPFFRKSPNEKKAAALGLLNAGIEAICRQKGWDSAPFRSASEAVRRLDYVNEWVWGKPFRDPDSLASAEVVCHHEVDAFTISFRMRKNPKSPPKTMQVATAAPTEFVFANLLGRCEWEAGRFKLFAKNGQLVGEVGENASSSR